MMVIDGKGMIFGRLASRVAKAALNGEEVHLINAEQIILSGDPRFIKAKFLLRRRAKNKGTPEHSPHWPRVPYMLVKRMIRGMLPWKAARGKAAYRRLFAYNGNPKSLVPSTEFEKIVLKKGAKTMSMLELCRMIGYSG